MSKYHTVLVFDVKIDIHGFGYFVLTICLETKSFETCFQQSAEGKMTAQSKRKHNAFSNNSTLQLDVQLTPRFPHPPPPL